VHAIEIAASCHRPYDFPGLVAETAKPDCVVRKEIFLVLPESRFERFHLNPFWLSATFITFDACVGEPSRLEVIDGLSGGTELPTSSSS